MSEPISFSLKTAAAATGLSESYLTDEIHAGRLKAKRSSVDKHGEPVGKYIITAAVLRAFVDGLVDA